MGSIPIFTVREWLVLYSGFLLLAVWACVRINDTSKEYFVRSLYVSWTLNV